jgi:two-component system, chemotaxis family, sensor kinase CheA
MANGSEASAFLEDLSENLTAIEGAIVRLETEPGNTDFLEDIFRAAHTIKGNAAMMNLTNLVALGHALETTLQESLAGKLSIGRDALRLFSDCRLAMAEIGEALRVGNNPAEIAILPTTDRLQVLLLEDTGLVGLPAENAPRRVEVRLHVARAELAPSVRAFLVETKLAELGTIVSKEPSDEKLESPDFLTSDRQLSFILETMASIADIQENLNVDLIENISVAEITSTGYDDPAPVRERVEAVADVQAGGGDTIRLSVQVLDRLLNLTGELVLANGGLTSIADELTNTKGAENQALRLTEKNREIFRIAADIQNIVMHSRMLPIEHVFSRFKRFVRDYAENAGKTIRLEISGEKTELDKRVIDEIVKPLTHLIRNALDHGIEPAAERIAAGKAGEATLKISAAQAGSSILVTVEDDGRGMNLEKILARAQEKNLVTAEKAARLTPEEIRAFIFMPGFSTKETADDVSGRGFGMDIVRESIERLSGDLAIHSVEGKGTRMTVKLPLTLAILTTLTFKVRNDVFALPLSVIEESLKVPVGSVVDIEGREILHSRNMMLPYLRLDRVLGYPPVEETEVNHHFAIVADLHGQKIALGIDEFLKKQDLVVKSLNENYRPVHGLAGASMLGDNEIVFILDLAEIVELNRQRYHVQWSESMAAVNNTNDDSVPDGMIPNSAAVPIEKLFDTNNKELIRKWISQSNKAAVKGIQMLTGNTSIAVKKSKGSRVKAANSRSVYEKIMERADDIYLFHLPMLPAAGAIDLILTKPGANRMSKLLFDAAGIQYEGEFDASPLLEITNILGSAYTNTLTFLTEKSVEPATPTLLQNVEEIRTLVNQRLGTPHGEILVVENQFHIKDEDIEVELVIYLNS